MRRQYGKRVVEKLLSVCAKVLKNDYENLIFYTLDMNTFTLSNNHLFKQTEGKNTRKTFVVKMY